MGFSGFCHEPFFNPKVAFPGNITPQIVSILTSLSPPFLLQSYFSLSHFFFLTILLSPFPLTSLISYVFRYTLFPHRIPLKYYIIRIRWHKEPVLSRKGGDERNPFFAPDLVKVSPIRFLPSFTYEWLP